MWHIRDLGSIHSFSWGKLAQLLCYLICEVILDSLLGERRPCLLIRTLKYPEMKAAGSRGEPKTPGSQLSALSPRWGYRDPASLSLSLSHPQNIASTWKCRRTNNLIQLKSGISYTEIWSTQLVEFFQIEFLMKFFIEKLILNRTSIHTAHPPKNVIFSLQVFWLLKGLKFSDDQKMSKGWNFDIFWKTI